MRGFRKQRTDLGADADAELIEKALAAFTKPHDANRPGVSNAERVYEAAHESEPHHRTCRPDRGGFHRRPVTLGPVSSGPGPATGLV